MSHDVNSERLTELRNQSIDLIFRLDENANKRQETLDFLWTLEYETTNLRKELLACIREVQELVNKVS